MTKGNRWRAAGRYMAKTGLKCWQREKLYRFMLIFKGLREMKTDWESISINLVNLSNFFFQFGFIKLRNMQFLRITHIAEIYLEKIVGQFDEEIYPLLETHC
jgi:hypothetical protein